MPRWLGPGLILIALAGCTPVGLALSSGAAVTTAAMQERGVSGATSDYGLRLTLSDALFKASLELYERVSLMISNQRVVLIGRVANEGLRARAEALVRGAGATDVTNRITVGKDRPLSVRARDTMTSLRLDSLLMFDRDVSAINYDVETRDGVVYVIGEAQRDGEQRRIAYLVSTLPDVKGAEYYIHVIGNPDQ